MVNEAVIIELLGADGAGGLRTRVCASDAAFSYGQLLQLGDENTAVTVNVAGAPCAGIAAMEKKNNDYSTTVTVFTDVIADLVCSVAASLGGPVTLASLALLNYVSGAANTTVISGASLLGYFEGTAATNEAVRVRVRL